MSFSSRRPSDTRPIGGSARRPVRWLCGTLIASFGLLDHAVAHSSRSYLAVATPLPLRFAPPPPERGTEPNPPVSFLPEPEVSEMLVVNEPGSASSLSNVDPAVSTPSSTSDDAPAAVPPDTSADVPPADAPLPILPDDLIYRTTAEDFLPYFVPPQLPSAPPSRATFQQR